MYFSPSDCERAQLAPMEMEQRQIGFRVQVGSAGGRLPHDITQQTAALDAGRDGQLQGLEHRGHHIHKRGLFLNRPCPRPRHSYQKRHVQGGVVNEKPVGLLPVLTQTFAVIPGYRHHGSIIHSQLLQKRDQPAHLGIVKSNLPVVRPAA